jgi:peptidoglycan/LPS O-acetylase OafA/YrhL
MMRRGLFTRAFELWARTRLGQATARAVSLARRESHLAYLDGWRGICILFVIAGHFVPGMGRLSYIGVEFFFALSGRLMAEILIHKRQPIGLFIKRRVARVVPALAVYVLLVGAVVNAKYLINGSPLKLLSPAAALLFFHNYVPYLAIVPAFEHTWSLAVEEHSYLLLVVIALISRRKSRLAAGIALGICALTFINALRLWFGSPGGAQFDVWRSDIRVASVLMAFAICLLAQRGAAASRPSSTSWLTPAATILAIACSFTTTYTQPPQLAICAILSATAVNSLWTSSLAFRKWLEHPFLIWAGTLSFSLYLWQQVFYWFSQGGLPKPLGVVLAVGCALWSFKRVEDPARNYLNARWARNGESPQTGMTVWDPVQAEQCAPRPGALAN